jgi:hypothetical protein
VQVVEGLGQGEHEARIGDRFLRVAAVDLVAGEARLVAQVFPARAAMEAGAAAPAEPGYADARAGRERHAGAGLEHFADDLVARHDGACGIAASSLSMTCRSVRQTPQARTATRTSPGPGVRDGRWRSTSGPPGASSTMAFTASAPAE